MRYLILGAGGMAGHMIAVYLKEQGEIVIGVSRKELSYCDTETLDACDFETLENLIHNGKYDYIINCIGILNQSAEENKSLAVLMNSYLPHFLVTLTKNLHTKVIHMSTDCVFSGTKGSYDENSFQDGKAFYDRSKALGEITDDINLTFRNSIVGPDIKKKGIGLLNWFMLQSDMINGFDKTIWTGVTTLTLAKAIHKASYANLSGVYNLVNNKTISKYELLSLFNQFSKKNLIIKKIDGIKQDKSLICTRNDFDFIVPSYDEMIYDLFVWIQSHKELYPHYKLK